MIQPHLIQWKPEYALGVPAVDHEHRSLIDLINQLYLELDQPNDSDAIERLLGEIYVATAAHFALEENEMRAARYSEYMAHKGDHEALLDELLELMDRYAERPQERFAEIAARLDDWFLSHFSTFDARLHGCLG